VGIDSVAVRGEADIGDLLSCGVLQDLDDFSGEPPTDDPDSTMLTPEIGGLL
jgi:hypothetical protein